MMTSVSVDVEKTMQRSFLILSALVLAMFMPLSAAVAQLTPGSPVGEMTLDRADENSAWRLSSAVTVDGRAPASPRGVYIQFGFMGCEPCERLATLAGEVFGDRVTMVYIHLDDVLIGAMELRAIWTQLYEVTRTGPYAPFIPVRRGSSGMMRELCGSDANAPSGLLISPDGTLHSLLLSPSVDEARALFATFLETL
jgi:hypothetical protein